MTVEVKKLIDVLDLDDVRHTSENTLAALKKALAGQGVTWEQIGGIVTDSPTPMVKLRRLVKEEFPHVITLACCLHVFNLIAKKCLDHPDMKETVNNDKVLVNFFTSSHFWGQKLFNWRTKEGISHGIRTFCESRWFSMAKVALSVESHEQGFRMCLAALRDKTESTPAINKNVQVVIDNRDHFTSNSVLVKLLQPVVDSIGRLERANTSVCDVWKEIGTVYNQIMKVDLSSYPRFQNYKSHCLRVLHDQVKVFDQPIYIAGFFLNPNYRQVAVSRKYLIEQMIKLLLSLAKLWGYKKADALTLRTQIVHYFSGEGAFRSTGTVSVARNYWLAVPSTPHTIILKNFAIKVCELVPHAGGVESLFSIMGATKTKSRNQMTVTHLKMVSQIELHSKAEHAVQQVDNEDIQIVNFEDELNSGLFLGVEDLEEFEAGVYADCEEEVEEDVMVGIETGFIDKIFDVVNFSCTRADKFVQEGGGDGDGDSDASWDANDLEDE
ncbi:ribonuclease H-like domain-containing protein [Melampsora americana]|nr:ribonuclease H-like domain-containing protein [Melampsora americana]